LTETTVDARGLNCPEPLVLTRKAMLAGDADRVIVLLSNPIAAENIKRLATNQGWDSDEQKDGEEIRLTLSTTGCTLIPGADFATAKKPKDEKEPVVNVFISSNLFGHGDDELGRILMRAFIKTIRELSPKPNKVIFANSGVKLTTQGSDLIEELNKLEELGVEIMSCGTCLDYFKLVGKLEVGIASNMYEIAQSLVDADRIVKP